MSSPADPKYDFVTKPKEDFYCPVTLDLLQEPYLTPCCGNHLSKDVYYRLRGKHCPICRKPLLMAVLNKHHQRGVLSLKVRCPNKAEGCKWEGEMSNQKQHLSTCQYVEESCPHRCGRMFIRLKMEEHKSQHCPLRPFTCQHCREYKATYQEVEKNHWPKCIKFPLPCPNKCGEERIERQHLKGHLEQTCPLEVIKCEFNYAGCGVRLQRRLMPTHLRENVEAHLSKTAILVQKQLDKIMKQFKQQGEKQGDKIKQQEDKIKQQGDTIKKQADKSKQQEDTIKKQADKIKQQEEKTTKDLIEQKRLLIKRQNLLFIFTCACIVLFFALSYKIHM